MLLLNTTPLINIKNKEINNFIYKRINFRVNGICNNIAYSKLTSRRGQLKERPAVSKEKTHRFHMERFNLN
jgi:hypothetical protein